jgi:hypothetical protein
MCARRLCTCRTSSPMLMIAASHRDEKDALVSIVMHLLVTRD